VTADAAFDRIVRTYGEALARVAWGYVHDVADHQDLMQDILVAIWRALPRLRNAASERTFVFRVAHNRGCTFVAQRRPHDPLFDDAPIVDSRAGVEEALDAASQRDRLYAAVRTLPASQRQAVMLCLEGLTIGEIAESQGTTENNVSVRLNRARQRLRELLRGAE
jgi:RNA polymerase sigma factor (sigma-70 family)